MAVSPHQAQEVIAVLRAATEANRNTSTRRGNVIHLGGEGTEQAEVVIGADLHGNRLNFERLLRVADLDNQPHRQLVMQEVCHGGPTYPGGGCMSHLLLEDVAALKAEHPERVHFLLSNHELAELTDFPIMKAGRMLNLAFRCGLQEFYGEAAEQVREGHLEFLRSCPLGLRLASGVFVCHSAPEHVDRDEFDVEVFHRPLCVRDFQSDGPVFELVWGRDFRPDNGEAFSRQVNAEVLIHGHEPCPEGFRVANARQIILDSCCEQSRYVILPAAGRLTQQDVVERIRQL